MSVAIVVRFVLWVWLALAIAGGHFLVLQRVPAPVVPALVLMLATGVLLAYKRSEALRSWFDALDLRSLIALHLTRFVGLYFLVLHQRGELPREVAVPAGIGDIAVAVMAIPVIWAPITDQQRLRAMYIWNVVGLCDIFLVIATVARYNLTEPESVRAFTQLPLSLLPLFLVPLIVATHVILFIRLGRARTAT